MLKRLSKSTTETYIRTL